MTIEGEVAARGGRERQRAYTLAGLGAAGTGIASLYTKYGRGGPKSGAGGSLAVKVDADSLPGWDEL